MQDPFEGELRHVIPGHGLGPANIDFGLVALHGESGHGEHGLPKKVESESSETSS